MRTFSTKTFSSFSMLRKVSQQGVDHAFNSLSKLTVLNSTNDGFIPRKVGKMQYSKYRLAFIYCTDISVWGPEKFTWLFILFYGRIQLSSPPTSSSASHRSTYYREGFIISLYLEDGNTGYGEVIHHHFLFSPSSGRISCLVDSPA